MDGQSSTQRLGRFEHELLQHLTDKMDFDANVRAVSPRPNNPRHGEPRRAMRRGLLAAAAVAALTGGIAGTVAISRPAPAFAVDRLGDGTVKVTVRSAIADVGALEQKLRSAGLRAHVLPKDHQGPCHAPEENLPMPPAVLSSSGPGVFILNGAALPAGTTLIVEVTAGGGGYVTISLSADGTPACR